MSDFKSFSKLVHDRFNMLSKHELFVTVDGSAVWEKYLASFPEGTNPVYKERTEHDCSCCKQFIRNIGNVVAVVDGKLQSVWGIEGADATYQTVADSLNMFVTKAPITALFRASEQSYGAATSKQLLESGAVKTWDHFHAKVAAKHYTKAVGQQVGAYTTTVQVFERGLKELSQDALETVLDLIKGKALYRGEEHLPALREFLKAKADYNKLDEASKNAFVWLNAGLPVARFRNTVIGTLIQDLSEGVDLERAVASFESKVAPTNYKRPTALITPRMVQDALKTIETLGLTEALDRRFAKISDVSVNNVLWVDNTVVGKMRGQLENTLLAAASKVAAVDDSKSQPIGIDEFVCSVLPKAHSMEVLLQGQHMNNFMSLTAPVHENSGKLFKWQNDFAWSYDGNTTDSIKEKVKKAGGNVTNAKLRVSLAWFNYDDLDIHVYEPNGNRIYFGNKCGKLDVDMNAGCGRSRTPVENVSWVSVADGKYRVHVNQYSQRETSDVGCVIEIESNGKLVQLNHPKAMKGDKLIAELVVKNGVVVEVKPGVGVTGGGISQEKWGVKTETFVKVNTMLLSPNHWDENRVGNKHHFFILEGCKNPEPIRGIYNEFLNSQLDKHRKVFEVLGDKTKCEVVDEQLSGVGFSSTRGDTVTVRVKGPKINKQYLITF